MLTRFGDAVVMTHAAQPNAPSLGYVRSMEFRVLGPLEVVDGDHRYSLGGPKQRAVLALLIAHAGKPVATGTLIDSVYGDEAPDRAHRSIHTFVSNLRSELGEVMVRAGEGYALVADVVSIDAVRFEQAVGEAALLDDPAEASTVLQKALALWRGLPYADVDVYSSLAAEITRLNELRVVATSRRIDADLAAGRHSDVIAELESLTVEYPLRESFWAQQMVALYRSGRQAEALRSFNKARIQLVEETGLDLSPELHDLERRILDHDPSLQLEPRSSIRKAAILVADVAEVGTLTGLAPTERDRLVEQQTRAIAASVAKHDGDVFAHRGSAIYAVFDGVDNAAAAAVDAQTQLSEADGLMRIAVGSGDVEVRSGGEVLGPPVNRAVALVGAAHGGQVLLATDAHQALTDAGGGWLVRSLGPHSFASMPDPITVHQVVVPGLPESYPPLRMGELPPAVPVSGGGLPGYELRGVVGAGVYGAVHRGYQPSVGREVAIKIIRSEYANHPEFIRRFEIEAQLVAKLEHPHIVPLHDYWREPDGAFLVMRWLQGGSLDSRLGSGSLDLREVRSMLGQIVPALEHAHRVGVVHRDLKPSNVLFDDVGNAYLTDFLIAKQVKDDGTADVSGDVRDLSHLIARCLQDESLSGEVASFVGDATEGRFASLLDLQEAWETATGEASTPKREARYTPTRNPYKGLRAFGELDARDFHGRADEIQQLVAAVGERRMVAVVGPSGIGKSSVVRAGLLPALRSGALSGSVEWLITDFMPGSYPYEELASALKRVSTETSLDMEDDLRRDERGLLRAAKRFLPGGAVLLLVVDQFEELFTLVEDEAERAAFLELLRAAVTDDDSNIRVVVTIRADFFDRPLRFGEFGELLGVSTIPIAAPSPIALREIIENPAAGVGVTFEPGLVERMVGDVKDQPGALPLLEFSLTELFLGRDADELSVDTYNDSGGVLGALGRRSEMIYESLDRAGRDAARQVLMRLVNVAESGGTTRRRVRLRELQQVGLGEGILSSLMEVFGKHRLLTFDRDPVTRGPTVEVAHEAILTHWRRMVEWISERREDLLLRSRLGVAVSDWEASGRADEYLLSPARLAQHNAWLATTDLSITSVEAEFVERSRTEEGRQRARREEDQARVMAVFAATQSSAQLEIDPERSVLLALEAVEMAQSAGLEVLEVTTALRRSLAEHRILNRFDGGGFVAVSPDGEAMATPSATGGVVIRELDGGDVIALLERPGASATGAEFSPVSGLIAVTYEGPESPLWIWNLESMRSWPFGGPGITRFALPHRVSFDETGELVATLLVDGVHVWSTANGQLRHVIELDDVAAQFVSGSSRLLLADWAHSSLRTFEVATGQLVSEVRLLGRPGSIAVSPDGQTAFATYQTASAAAAYDVDSGDERWRTTVDRAAAATVLSDGGRVAVGGEAGQITLLDAATGEVRDVLRGGHGAFWSIAAVPRRPWLATSGRDDSTTLVWDVEPGSRHEVARFDCGVQQPVRVAYAPFPSQVFVSDASKPAIARVIETSTLKTVVDVVDPVVDDFLAPRIHEDGSFVANTTDGMSRLLDVVTGDVQYAAPEGFVVMAVSHCGSLLVLGALRDAGPTAEQARVVELSSGDVVATLECTSDRILEFSYDDALIVDWSNDGVRLFDTSSWRVVLALPDVRSLRPMPNGTMVSIVDRSGTLWHAHLDRLIVGKTIEEASEWNASVERGTVIPMGHVASPDGSLVAVMVRGARPATIWDTVTGVQVASLNPHLGVGDPQVFFHPDEPHVTLLGAGGILLTYALDTNELVEIAKSRVTRSLSDAERRAFLHV